MKKTAHETKKNNRYSGRDTRKFLQKKIRINAEQMKVHQYSETPNVATKTTTTIIICGSKNNSSSNSSTGPMCAE